MDANKIEKNYMYHGLDKVVEVSTFGECKNNNDFRLEFYCNETKYWQLYLEILEEDRDGLYIQDIMKGKIKNDDQRIPRNISK